MTPKIITSFLLFISAYSPLFVILAIKDYDINSQYYFTSPIIVYTILILSIISVIFLYLLFRNISGGNIIGQVIEVKNRSTDLINYTIPYLISFLGVELSKSRDFLALLIFLFLMLILTITSKSIFLNPLLGIMGFGLYDLEYRMDNKKFTRIILCNKDIHSGDIIRLKSLTKYLYLVTSIEENYH